MTSERSLENELLKYALKYADWGLRVFPLHSVREGACTCLKEHCHSAGKHPRTKNGVKDATLDRAQIQRWWEMWSNANIGIATGLYEGRGLYVIDVDSAKGADLDSLKDCDLAELLCSRIVRTGSGGYHIYLKCSVRLPNTMNKLGPFIDTRGEGGYVVAPPGHNAYGPYVWETPQNRILPMPATLLLKLGAPADSEHLGTTKATAAEAANSTPSVQAERKKTDRAAVTREEGKQDERAIPAQVAEARDQATTSSTRVEPADVVPALPQTGVANEGRNTFLVSIAGNLRRQGLNVDEIRSALLSINEARYGGGRHPRGPLALEEMEQTIFKSIVKWENQLGQPNAKQPVVDSLTDLMAREIPEPHWLVPELICEGLVLLAGKTKLGKSWLALAMALSCAQGTANGGGLVLGRYAVEQTRVLYLSLEDSPKRFQDRIRSLLKERSVPANFDYSLSWRPLKNGGMEALEALLISKPGTGLIVIDTLAKVRTATAKSGNVYQEDYALMGELHDLVVNHNVTILLVHHVRKEFSDDPFDQISGSTGLTGAADTSIVLKRDHRQPEGTFYITGRDIAEAELAVTFHEDCTWTCSGNADDRQVSQAKQEILTLLEQNGAMTPSDIAKELEKPYGTIKSTLYRMAKEGAIVRNDRKQYTLPSSTHSSLFNQGEHEAAD